MVTADIDPISGVTLDQPTLVLLSGLLLELMLFGLFWMMSRSNSKVLTLAEEMTTALSSHTSELAARNRDLQDFAQVVSHDLKTPIRNICSFTEILDQDVISHLASNDDKQHISEYLDKIAGQALKSQNLITDVLEYSVVGKREVSLTEVDSAALVAAIANQLALKSDQWTLMGHFPVLYTDSTRLEQVFANLIDNAIKYNPHRESATLEIAVTRVDNRYEYSVTDNGPGIDQRYHQRIFNPFTKLSNDDTNSSGIGLSIVKRLVEMQGGQLRIDSAPTLGTSVSFTWPADEIPKETVNG